MSKVFCVYRRELAAYFNTPIAYFFIPIFIGLTAGIFLKMGSAAFFFRGVAEMRYFFFAMPWALFIFAPAITLRLWSDELRVGTAELLLTLPYDVWQLVVGKFLAAYTVLACSLALTLGVPIAVGYAGNPDWGPIVCGYIGSLLMGGALISMGAFVSSLTQNQVIALLLSLLGGVVLVLVLSPDLAAFVSGDNKTMAMVIEYLGVRSHFEDFEKGILSISDTVYFLSVMVVFNLLNVFWVESRRY